MYACMYVCMDVCTYVRMYVCTYACRYVCMYACMYVYTHTTYTSIWYVFTLLYFGTRPSLGMCFSLKMLNIQALGVSTKRNTVLYHIIKKCLGCKPQSSRFLMHRWHPQYSFVHCTCFFQIRSMSIDTPQFYLDSTSEGPLTKALRKLIQQSNSPDTLAANVSTSI